MDWATPSPTAPCSGRGNFSSSPKTASAFLKAYGAAVFAFDQYNGNLQSNGESLALIKPGGTPVQDVVVDKVRYDRVAPWPTLAIQTGSAIQLIDAAQENTRPLNWFATYTPPVVVPEMFFPARTNDGWRFVSMTGPAGTVGGRRAFAHGSGLRAKRAVRSSMTSRSSMGPMRQSVSISCAMVISKRRSSKTRS
jgi:hypothetical protein